jgi:hypothetical protein
VDDKRWGAILFLNKRNALIADEVQGSGTVDHAPFIHAKRALTHRIAATVLVGRNHFIAPLRNGTISRLGSAACQRIGRKLAK